VAYLGLESVRVGDSAQCVNDIFTLHFPTARTVIDCTYGKGRFWDWAHSVKVVGVDIDPQSPATIKADYCHLPFMPASCDVLVFDPPFIFTPGINRIIGTKRFFLGAESLSADKRTRSKQEIKKPKNSAELLQQTEAVLKQRNIATQGIVLKGQDLIVNKPDWWSYNVMKLAEQLGMGMPTDILLQHSKAHRMRDPRWQQQYHFRRAHCIYLIYKWGIGERE